MAKASIESEILAVKAFTEINGEDQNENHEGGWDLNLLRGFTTLDGSRNFGVHHVQGLTMVVSEHTKVLNW